MAKQTDPVKRATRQTRLFAALVGVVSAGALLAVAELLALIVSRSGSPILAVGSFIIDIFPPWAKDLVIALFGTNDKLVLLLSLAGAVVIAASIAGLIQFAKPPIGIVLLVAAGLAASAALVTRAGATIVDALPTVVGSAVAAVLFHLLIVRLRAWRGGDGTASAIGVDRRAFLRFTLITGAAAAVVGAGSRVLNGALNSVADARAALTLPKPGSLVTIPAGAEFDIPGLTPLFVPNEDFYRIDTALTVPTIDPETWTLTIGGMVDEEITLTFQDLVDMGVDEYVVTLTCVSNEVGGPLLGNARWLGVPIRDVLELAGVQRGADMVLSTSVDGFTAGTPLDTLTDPDRDAILAIGMNGEPLPLEHGFPVRMVVPGLYGYVSATKWLTELKVTTYADDEGYWTPRGWDAEGPIKLSSRLDTPRVDKAIPAGPTKVAGVAWAQPVGVASVEVKIDGSDWMPATLSTPINDDTWVQWYLDWDATSGTHTVIVRATDNDGNVQIEDRVPPAPNGSTGLQSSLVRVS